MQAEQALKWAQAEITKQGLTIPRIDPDSGGAYIRIGKPNGSIMVQCIFLRI